MKVRLTERDIELIIFLGKYKKIKGTDCKKIYRSKDYYRKRLKVLEKAKYIKRDRRIIKLDVKGRTLAEMIGYSNYNICRNKNYQERIEDIIKIATLSLGSNIEFIPSWKMKEAVYTNYGKKYIGKLKFKDNDYTAYYISKRNSLIYTKQIFTDININILADRVILFIEDFKMLSKANKYFITGKQETIIINPTEKNLELMQFFENINLYEILMDIYQGEELLLSNWKTEEYRIEEEKYIICMPFIDVEKLHSLNCKTNFEYDKEVEIVTLKENERKIKEIVKGKINIIFLDDWIERYKKLYNEMLEQIKKLK